MDKTTALLLTLGLACCRASLAFTWQTATPASQGMDQTKLEQARDYALTGGGSGYIVRHGKLVFAWGSPTQRYDLKSSTKSIGVTALGLAMKDGKMEVNDKAATCHPTFGVPPSSNADTGWLDDITLFHLATQTAGFDKSGGYTALLFEPGTKWSYSDGGPNWLAECITLAYREDLSTLMFRRVFTPLGITSSDLTWRKNQYRDDTIDGIMRREFGSGISANVDALARIGYLYLLRGKWEGQQILPESFIDMARTRAPGVPGLPVVLPDKYPDASDHYGLLWWNNGDGTLTNVPTDAYWSWGMYDSHIVVFPGLDIVAARAGNYFGGSSHDGSGYAALKPFVEPIALSVLEPHPPSDLTAAAVSSSVIELGWRDNSRNEETFKIDRRPSGSDVWTRISETGPNVTSHTDSGLPPNALFYYQVKAWNAAGGNSAYSSVAAATTQASAGPGPYPKSPVITGIQWEPAANIRRAAEGSDNWPATWGDDDNLYTAYGDGWGFQTGGTKLSLGFAKVSGSATSLTGTDIPSPDEIAAGGGRSGKKASGILMVDGTLYIWVRNADNSGHHAQLAWSTDHGKNWTWAGWTFTEFGYCGFLNYGQNYGGVPSAHANHVYTYTPDGPDAYKNYDRYILMRVAKDQVKTKSAYEFFKGLDTNGNPVWTSDIGQRGGVFSHTGRCWRHGISYNAGLGRYLWWQRQQTDDGASYTSGLAIFDAPEPWGPWTTVFFTEPNEWDVDAGEHGNFPTKWMSSDGKTVNLVFSGNDAFNVRAATLSVSQSPEPPQAPGDLSVRPVSSSQLEVSWRDNSNNESRFKIDRRQSGTSAWDRLAEPGANTTRYTDSGLPAETKFYYQVKAHNSAGDSPYSNVGAATTPADLPAKPDGLNATPVSSTQIKLTWTDNSGNESGFRIERSLGSAVALTVSLKTYNGRDVTPTVETAGTANAFQTGALVVNDRADTWTSVPAALSGKTRLLTARDDREQSPTDNKYVVTVSGACTVYLPLDPRYSGAKLAWMDTAWTDSGMTCDSSALSGWTIWKREIANAGDITLGCDTAARDGVCYVFVGGAAWESIETAGENATSFTDAGLTADTTYAYRVAATNSAGVSDYSDTASATTQGSGLGKGGEWRYFKGTAAASDPADAWRRIAFDDSAWASGPGPIGYSDYGDPLGSELADMQGSYTCVFLRRTFALAGNPAGIAGLRCVADFDDAFIMWINGEEIARVNAPGAAGEALPHDAVASSNMNASWSNTFTGAAIPALNQTNVLAVQVFNRSLTSGDCLFDAALWWETTDLPAAEDADDNGMPDEWEAARLSELSEPSDRCDSADPDGDGLSNLEEWVCGSDPTTGSSLFDLDVACSPGGPVVRFTALAATGAGYAGYARYYTLEACSFATGAAWQPVPPHTNILGAGQTVTCVCTERGGVGSYRGRVWLESLE
ncbi:MAG: fibronectin type III domain-containing protein [Kiritimatiellae bacterium]|nr:fibronectin type III domain-containing protein [Kiritimatiellia bacterium]